MRVRRPETAPLKRDLLARAMRHGSAETNWGMATALSSNVSSKTANDSANHAGRLFRTTECNNPGHFIAGSKTNRVLSDRR
jgi:hypothetical protein